jgi:hypothetical protein
MININSISAVERQHWLFQLELAKALGPIPKGWERRQDTEDGEAYYLHCNTGISKKEHPARTPVSQA